MTTGRLGVDRLQEIVDALGSRLSRSVLVDDHMLSLVAVGQDFGDADEARVWSLLNRRTRPEDVEYALMQAATEPMQLEANGELGLHARLCIPIRFEQQMLGFMWLIDRDRSLTSEQINDAVAAAKDVALVLRQRLMISDRDTAFVSYLVGELVNPDLPRSAQAANDLRLHGFISNDAHVSVMVVAGADPHHTDTDITALSDAVRQVGRSQPPGTWVSSESGRRAIMLVARARPVDDLMQELGQRLYKTLQAESATWWVAVGGSTQGLAGACTSHYQATVALSVGQRLNAGTDRPSYVTWDELGPYSLLGQLPSDALLDDTLPLGLFTLLRSGNSSQLLDTVETFLDCGGDKQRTARVLGIHRTTLYYRLDRIEAITAMSLAEGANRLMLHLAIKLHRLRGPRS